MFRNMLVSHTWELKPESIRNPSGIYHFLTNYKGYGRKEPGIILDRVVSCLGNLVSSLGFLDRERLYLELTYKGRIPHEMSADLIISITSRILAVSHFGNYLSRTVSSSQR